LKKHDRVNRREKTLHELKSIAKYQFGENGDKFIPDNVKTKGMYHKRILSNGTQLALLNKDYGLFRLNLPGGEILKELGIHVVNIDFDNEDNALVFVYNSYVAESVAFEHAITIYYNNLIEKGDIEAFGEMLELYNKKKRLSADFLEKFQLPIKEEKDAVDVYKMLTNEENRKKSSLKKKLKELKEIIIANNYKDDILVSFVEKQNELELRNKAKTYKLVKNISLAVCIIASPMLFLLPIALWYVVFCVKDVHSKIPFLVKGEEAVESVKKIDEQSIKG
jgi:hypothetical protein